MNDGSRNVGWLSFLLIAAWSGVNLVFLVVTLEATWVAVSYVGLFGGGSLVFFLGFYAGDLKSRVAALCGKGVAFPILNLIYWTVILTDPVPPIWPALAMYPIGAVATAFLMFAGGSRLSGAAARPPCSCSDLFFAKRPRKKLIPNCAPKSSALNMV
uniref:Uncharacterized protein n=1 Tax=Haptolina ericina TaxID=156174 RepID=A0A7S3BNC7_9EUKA